MHANEKTFDLDALRDVLEPGAMTAALRRHWRWPAEHGTRLERCDLTRVHPRTNGRHGFVFEVRTRGGAGSHTSTLLGELAGAGAPKQYERAVQCLQRSGFNQGQGQERSLDGSAIACLPDLGVVVRLPGIDECLPGLAFAHRPEAFAPVLDHLGIAARDDARPSAELLGHRLGKRAVIRMGFSVPGMPRRTLVVKAFRRRGKSGADPLGQARALWESGMNDGSTARVARPLCYLDDVCVAVMEDAPGNLLAALDGERAIAGSRSAGAALARLHGCDAHPSRTHAATDEMALLERSVWLAVALVPQVDARLRRNLATVCEALARHRDVVTRPVHRDYYDKQVFVDGARAVLIDLDTLSLADPAIDIGNFLAHVELERCRGTLHGHARDEAFKDGYGSMTHDLSRRADDYLRAALLRLACIYALPARTRRVVPVLLDALEASVPSPAVRPVTERCRRAGPELISEGALR